MKKIIAFVLSLCIVGGSAPAAVEYLGDISLTASAADIVDSGECGENVTWTLDSEGTLTISGTGDMTNYDWDISPFNSNYNIKSVIIENGVTSIGDKAFYHCTSLTSITIPDSVINIGGSAFSSCESLTSITIPNSVTSIGDYAFYYCTSLTSITIPDSVTSIGYDTFRWCTSLTSITIPNSVTSIGVRAFNSCKSLESITIPDSVTSIGYGAFENCTSLLSITFPDSVTNIDDFAFSGCDSLTSITIPSTLTSMGYIYYGCSKLKSIIILNPDCDLRESGGPFPIEPGAYTGTIYGYANSTAQTYAELHEFKFIALAANGEILGNVNGDTSVDSSDAALVLSHYAQFQSDGAGKFTEEQLAVADYNSDSNIDSSDAALILKAYAENQSK